MAPLNLPVDGEKTGQWGLKLNAALQAHQDDLDGRLSDTQLAATYTAKGQMARSPSLWRPAKPPVTLVSIFQAGHGWTASGGVGSSNLNDTTDYVLGTQSAKVTTVTTGPTNLNLDSPTLTAADLTGKTVKVLIKVEGLANLNSLRLLVGDATFANYRNFNLNANEVKPGASYLKEGEWTWLSLSYGGASQTGTGARTAVTKFRFQVNSLAGTAMTVHVGAVGYSTTPTGLYPNGVVSVCFDDGRLSPFQNAKPKLDTLGWPASAFPIRDKIVGDGTSTYMSIAQLKQCREISGWEIGCHADTGMSHDAGFDTMTAAQVEADILANRQWIYDNGLGRGEGFAWPQGIFTKAAEDAAARLVAYGRLNTTWSLETWPAQNLMRIRSAANTTSQSVMQTLVDQTKQEAGWLCLTFHEITSTGTEPLSCSTAIFNAVMDYIKTQGLAVMPMIDVLRQV